MESAKAVPRTSSLWRKNGVNITVDPELRWTHFTEFSQRLETVSRHGDVPEDCPGSASKVS